MLLHPQPRRTPAAALLDRWWYCRLASVHPLGRTRAVPQVWAAQRRGSLVVWALRQRILGPAGVEGLRQAAQASASRRDVPQRANQTGRERARLSGPGTTTTSQGCRCPSRPIQLRPRALAPCRGRLLDDLPTSGIDQRPAMRATVGAVPIANVWVADQDAARPPLPVAGQGRAPLPYAIHLCAGSPLRTSINVATRDHRRFRPTIGETVGCVLPGLRETQPTPGLLAAFGEASAGPPSRVGVRRIGTRRLGVTYRDGGALRPSRTS